MQSDYNGNDIISYSALQHIRKKSSMYGFQTGSVEGNILMTKEIVDNSIDEALDTSRIYPINITYFVAKDKSTYQCLITDNGRGIPPEKIVDVYTKEFTSGKYEEVAGYNSSIGTNGIGSKVVSALSGMFKAFTCRKDGFGYLSVRKGEVKDHLITKKRGTPWSKPEDTGTVVLFQPDTEILTATANFFGKNEQGEEREGFLKHVDRMEFYSLFKRNVKITIRVVDGLLRENAYRSTPQEMWKYLSNVDNFNSKIEFESDLELTPRKYVMNKFGLKEPIWDLGGTISKEPDLKNTDDRLSYDIDIFIDDHTLKGEGGLIGAVNATPISDQSSIHFTMLQNVLKMFLDGYILDKEEITFFETKYVIPISGCVSVGWKGAGFDGQDKTKFTDHVFGDFYRSHLRRQLKTLPESVWERLFEIISDHFKMAFAKYSKQQFRINRDLKGIGYMLKRSGAYIPCDSTDSTITELIITEGDSAAGRVKTERNALFQSVYKLGGKPINPERADAKRLVKNDIYMDLMELTGVRPTDTDLTNMRFSKIIILADADADGYHIVALLLAIFKRINPLILIEGRVFIANPPLYSFRVQNQKRPIYLRDQSALMDMKTEIYRRMIDIYFAPDDAPEQKLEGDAYRALCAVVEHIGEVVNYVGDQLNIDPYFLEQLLHCVDYLTDNKPDTKAIEREMADAGVDRVLFDKDADTITLVTQGLDHVISLSHLQDTMQSRILPLYEKWHWKRYNLFVTTRHPDL